MFLDSSDRKYVDLHIHTKHSDGSATVQDVLNLAAAKGLQAISITDHDCIDAYPAAMKLGAELGIEVIPGVELSSEIDGVDIHVLGYYIDFGWQPLVKKLKEMKDARYVRARKIVENLNKQDIDLRFETVLKIAGDAAIGRPHIAQAMLREELIYSFREAFDRYLGYDSPAYVEKLHMQPKEVFDLVLQAGGIPVLAHPGSTHVDERIPEFVRDGIQGIEVFHPDHSSTLARFYKKLCKKHGLLMTGGSDYHSPDHVGSEVGSEKVPASLVDELKAAHAAQFEQR